MARTHPDPANRTRGRRAKFGLVQAMILGALALGPPSAMAEIKSIWGPLQLPDGRSAFTDYKNLKVDDLQLTIDWADVAANRPTAPRDPGDPAYAWPASVDQAISAADQAGIGISLMVLHTPGWANGGRTRVWAPTKAGAYADFLAAAARRYPTVRRWMIWGEPNRHGQFQPVPRMSPVGPRRYALLLDAAYGALKAANRRNIVIGGMTYTAGDVPPRWWLHWLRLPSGKPPRLDWWGHNPFTTRFPDLTKPVYVP
ncbi:MAG: polysaccharide biosynthesis protein PslG, partial [Mycobacterium sp.]|nr:polysaccharide biosynthesis protein PslG [Mycobacterium sp.]